MIIVVIPAYNEEKTISQVVKNTLALHVTCYMLHVLVVDDGSSDKTAQVARQAGAVVLSHPINCGLGAALATGIEAALFVIARTPTSVGGRGDPEFQRDCFASLAMTNNVIVTLDADGQHDPAEVPKLIEPILKNEADVVIGSRFLKIKNLKFKIPLARLIANGLGNLATYLLFGIRVTDSQSGFRAFSAAAARKIRIRTNTMEVSSEIIREIKMHNLRFQEAPITPIYTDYSLSKGQGFFKGVETLWKLIVLKFFR